MKKIIIICFFFLGVTIISTKFSLDGVENEPGVYIKERDKFHAKKRGNINYQVVKKGRNNYIKTIDEKMKRRDAGLMGWTDLGPANVGGRIRALVIDPNNNQNIFVGAAAGGIWNSTNGGGSWNLVTNFLDSYPVTDIAYNPFNDNQMLATTGEFRGGGPEFSGGGLLQSNDNGLTWFEVGSFPSTGGSPFLFISDIEFDPSTSNRIYVGTTSEDNSSADGNPVLYRSDDLGASWTVLFAPGQGDIVTDIEINPNNPNQIFTGTDRNVYVSNDGGVSFTSLIGGSPLITTPTGFSFGRCEVEVNAINNNVIYVSRNLGQDSDSDGFWDIYRTVVWRSNDGGNNWVQEFSRTSNGSSGDENICPLNTQGQYCHVLWSDPTDTDLLLIGGINLWKWDSGTNSLNRISNWPDDINGNSNGDNNSLHADFHVICESINYNGISNSQVFFGNDGGIYSTNNIWSADDNTGWIAHNDDLNITQLYGADMSLGDNIYGGSQDNSFFVDINSSNGLQTYFTFTTGDGGPGAISPGDASLIYGTTQRGRIYRSTDSGTTFCNIASFSNRPQLGCCDDCSDYTQLNNSPLFIAPFKIGKIKENFNEYPIFLGARNLWISSDMGANWQNIKAAVTSSSISAIELNRSDIDDIIVGHENGEVFITNNGTSNSPTWIQINNSITGNNFITDVDIQNMNENRLLISAGGYHQNQIFYSPDGGASWLPRPLPIAMHVETITFHPTKTGWIYAGTDIGIYASEDYGETWNTTPLYVQNEGPVYTQVSELFWQGNGSSSNPFYLCAATHGRGVWRSEFPVFSSVYVDKEHTGYEDGSLSAPYNTFQEAYEAVGHGAEIIFLSEGTHNDIDMDLVIKKRIKVTLNSGPITLE